MITKYISNCKVHTNVCFSNVCMQIKLVDILTYVPILSYENGVACGTIQKAGGNLATNGSRKSFHWFIVYTVRRQLSFVS